MCVKAKQLQLSENRAFGSVLHFNAQWLEYVLCSLTFKNSALCNQSLHMNFL